MGFYEPFAGTGHYSTLYPKVRYNRVRYNGNILYYKMKNP